MSMFSQQDDQLLNLQSDTVLLERDREMYAHQQLAGFSSFPAAPHSSFAQTKKDDDERFFQVFPDARLAAQTRNQLNLNGLVQFQGTYGFFYDSGTGNPSRIDGKNYYPPSLDLYAQPLELPSSAPAPAHFHSEYSQVEISAAHPDTVSFAVPATSELSPALYDYSQYYYSPQLGVLHNSEPESTIVEPQLLKSDPRSPYLVPIQAYSQPVREEPLMDFLPPPETVQSTDNIVPHYDQPSPLPNLEPIEDGETSSLSPPPPSPPSRSSKSRSGRGHDFKAPSPAATSTRRTATSRQQEKKGFLSCFFCRHRKIACGQPSADNPDRTCNQCLRRSLKCEYPLESRRGMRRKKPAPNEEGVLPIASASSKP